MKVLVTGGASGLGLAISKKLLASGHHVLLTYCRSVEAAEELRSQFVGAETARCDFSSAEDLQKLEERLASFGPEGLVNNALESMSMRQFQKQTLATLERSFVVNVLPTLQITQACIRHFRIQKFGRIVNILTSYLFNVPPTGTAEYVANKAYLQAMGKSWAAENARYNITVNSVSPSVMKTNLQKGLDERVLEMSAQGNPFGRLVTIEEVAEAVEFLLLATPQINGINLLINGGAILQ